MFLVQVMALFTRLESSSAVQATQRSGIDKLVPGMTIDDVLFDPCGYSMNGIDNDVSIFCALLVHLRVTAFLYKGSTHKAPELGVNPDGAALVCGSI